MESRDGARLGEPAGPFGQPPVTLWRSGRWLLEVVFWTSPFTAVHDHPADGAFTVVSGTLVEGCYRLAGRRTIADGVDVGTLERLNTQVVAPGVVVPITAGRGFIHSTAHLAPVTVTLAIRALGAGEQPVWYNYHAPGVAVAERGWSGVPLGGAMMQLLAAQPDGEAERFLEDAARRASPADVVRLLAYFAMVRVDRPLPDAVHAALAGRFPELAPLAGELVRAVRLRYALQPPPGMVSAEGRIACELLSTCRSREEYLAAVRALFPDRGPEAMGAELVATASRERMIPVTFNAPSLEVVRLLLAGLAPAQVAATMARDPRHGDPEAARRVAEALLASEQLGGVFRAAPSGAGAAEPTVALTAR